MCILVLSIMTQGKYVGGSSVSLNANERIEYDAQKDGKKEVFYDFLDYQKLAESIKTVEKNEHELDTEYNRLYNLAESNRKDIINAWNTFGLSKIDVNSGKYVTGTGTASIKGAIQALGTAKTTVASTNQVRRGYSAVLPTAGWSVGTMPEYSFSNVTATATMTNGVPSISVSAPGEGYYTAGTPVVDVSAFKTALENAKTKHTDTYSMTAKTADLGEDHKYRYIDASALVQHTETYTLAKTEYIKDLGTEHKTRIVDATNVYNKGVEDGKKSVVIPSVTQQIATATWMNNQTCTYDLKKDTTYTLYAVTGAINSYQTFVKLKTSGSNSWNLLDYQKTAVPEGSGGNGVDATFAKEVCSGDLRADVTLNATNALAMTIKPKKNMTVVLSVGAYDGYGMAFIQ